MLTRRDEYLLPVLEILHAYGATVVEDEAAAVPCALLGLVTHVHAFTAVTFKYITLYTRHHLLHDAEVLFVHVEVLTSGRCVVSLWSLVGRIGLLGAWNIGNIDDFFFIIVVAFLHTIDYADNSIATIEADDGQDGNDGVLLVIESLLHELFYFCHEIVLWFFLLHDLG